MSEKRYIVRLTEEEREHLKALLRKGTHPARRLQKAQMQILLKADESEDGESWNDVRIMEALNASASMVYRVRQQLVEEGLEATLARKKRATPPVPPVFDGRDARLLAGRWTGVPSDVPPPLFSYVLAHLVHSHQMH